MDEVKNNLSNSNDKIITWKKKTNMVFNKNNIVPNIKHGLLSFEVVW